MIPFRWGEGEDAGASYVNWAGLMSAIVVMLMACVSVVVFHCAQGQCTRQIGGHGTLGAGLGGDQCVVTALPQASG